MQVGNVTGAAEPSGTKSSIGGTDTLIGRDAFLQLLLAQLKYCPGPDEPMKSTEYVSQLAQLSKSRTIDQAGRKTRQHSGRVVPVAGHVDRRPYPDVRRRHDFGQVIGARVTSDGVVAELSSGKTLLVSSGVKVSN